MVNSYCRVCGLEQYDEPPWNETGGPSFNICSCCGAEFGFHDRYITGVRITRKEWLDSGAQWFRPEEKPTNWNLEEQLNNIPPEWV